MTSAAIESIGSCIPVAPGDAPLPYRADFQVPLPDALPGLLTGEYEGTWIPLHTHEALVVVLPVTEFLVLGRGAPVHTGPGDICLINTLELHGAIAGATHCQARVLLVSPNLLQEITAGVQEESGVSPRFDKTIVTDPALAQAFAALWEELQRPVKSSHVPEKGRSLLQQLLCRAVVTERPPNHGNRTDEAIRRVQEHLQHHVADSLALHQLSALAGLSKSYLVREFHRVVGLPPHAYQLQLRVARAARLLAHGYSLSRAAYEAGFADQSHLSRRFKTSYGLTPLRFARAAKLLTRTPAVRFQPSRWTDARAFNNGGQDPGRRVG